MAIPLEISRLIDRLNNELNEIEQEANQGLTIVRMWLDRFPDNLSLIQLFGSFNNYLMFVEISRRRIEYIKIVLATDIVIDDRLQEIGEELAEQLGKAIEAKITIKTIKNRLEN